MHTKNNKYLFALEFLIAVILTVSIHIIAANVNYGLEGDEVFSYISSSSIGGFKGITYLEDQTWYDADYFRNAVTATGTERFNIKMVVENQVMDTHPPLYYLFLNVICSIFEGQYSKWFGIGLNIFFLLFVEAGLFLLLRYFIKNEHLSLILSTIFCCSFLTVNMTLFIRMYVLLMAITLFQSWYHLIVYDRIMSVEEYPFKKYWKTYAILALLTIAGALTHYYFLIYQCLITAALVLALWYHKKFKDAFRYIAVMAGCALVYIGLYPAALTHLFFKYRGRDAVHKFLKESSIFGEASSMFSSYNRQMFKNCLPIILLILTVLTVVFVIKKKVDITSLLKLGFLTLPSLIYFYGISKASPFITIRYISPVAALLYAAFIIWAKYLIDGIQRKKVKTFAGIILCACFFFTTFYFFKPPVKAPDFAERRDVVDELSKEASYCVYICKDETYWKMWEDYINYPSFQGLYFINWQTKAPITDEKMLSQEKLVFYIDKEIDKEEVFAYLKTYLPLKQYEIRYEANYADIILGE